LENLKLKEEEYKAEPLKEEEPPKEEDPPKEEPKKKNLI